MDKKWSILVINFGSTSSQLAYCRGDEIVAEEQTEHSARELLEQDTKEKVLSFRRGILEGFLERTGLKVSDMDAIAARGTGKSGSYRHGAYLLSPELGADARGGEGSHQGLFSSTVIADELSQKYGVPAYLYDVVPTDEIYDVARICGIPGYRRQAHSHTLNCRATARMVAEEMGLSHDGATFIVSHLGGGFGTMCYKDGVIVDTYSSEEGSFTPSRAGRVPADFLARIYGNSEYTGKDIRHILRKEVGLYGHLGTYDCKEVERRIAGGDKKAELVYGAMAYQVSKDIGAMATVACGNVDAIILTGGIAGSELMTGWISRRVEYIAPVRIVPGSMEIEGLARGVSRVLSGEEQVNNYGEVGRARDLFESL